MPQTGRLRTALEVVPFAIVVAWPTLWLIGGNARVASGYLFTCMLAFSAALTARSFSKQSWDRSVEQAERTKPDLPAVLSWMNGRPVPRRWVQVMTVVLALVVAGRVLGHMS